jgi:hypothetical protein
MESKV